MTTRGEVRPEDLLSIHVPSIHRPALLVAEVFSNLNYGESSERKGSLITEYPLKSYKEIIKICRSGQRARFLRQTKEPRNLSLSYHRNGLSEDAHSVVCPGLIASRGGA